jgi:group II intron reverse transcriptase/maturase
VATTSDKTWLLIEQRRLHKRSRIDPDYVFRKLWGLITDPRNLRIAVARVASNRGKHTAGVDGKTVRRVLVDGIDVLIDQVRSDMRSGAYAPSPARRVLIPKAGAPGKSRPLGIPTVTDRIVQAAVKNILEPIFEADFCPVSFGFRPGKSAHAALEYLRMLLRPKAVGTKAERRLPYQWAVEGDIKGCFDNIDHHAVMVRVRRRIGDNKVSRLVLAFLKSGVLSETQFLRTDAGTPQGGILSPLLANIALSAIEERYERHAWPRRAPKLLTNPAAIAIRAHRNRDRDRRRGLSVVMPIRYADDFILLVSAPHGCEQQAHAERLARAEKNAVARTLSNEWTLELSEAKTLVTPVTQPLRFLGHHVRVRAHPTNGKLVSTTVIPKDRSHLLRERVKNLFRRATVGQSLADRLRHLNPILRGWGNFYRHAWGAKYVFKTIDHYVWWTIYRWLRKKHPNTSMKVLHRRYCVRLRGRPGLHWKDEDQQPFEVRRITVQQFKLGWLKPPTFAITEGEPDAY